MHKRVRFYTGHNRLEDGFGALWLQMGSSSMLPRHSARPVVTAVQVTELADAVGRRMDGGDVLSKVLAYAGLRWGEAVALRGPQVDVLPGRVRVRESATLVNGEPIWGSPFTQRARTVVIPSCLAEELAGLIDGDGLIFTSPDGHPLRSPNFWVECGDLQ